jgi:spermidine synthase
MRHHSTFIPIISMGVTSMLIQITVLRLLLSTFSGNELDIGITLSFWLTWAGIGSYIGRKIKFRYAFALSFIIMALLLQPTVFAIEVVRPVLSLGPGEAVSFVSTIFSTAVTLFPLCFVLGLQFPSAVAYAGQYDRIPTGSDNAGKVYGLESLGAFIGGVLFTFVVSGNIGAIELCSFLALISVLLAAYISKKKILALFFVFPVALYFGLHKTVISLPWQGIKPSQVVESKYGEITVIKIGRQSSIYGNGQLFFTYPDQPGDEFRAHMQMALHPLPSKILVIGGSLGTLKEFLKYPVEHIDFLELNPKIVRVSLDLLSILEDKDAMKDPRVKIIIKDGRRFIKRSRSATYDLMVLNLPPPSTAGINRFYTSNFFREVKGVLNEGGILAVTLPQSTGYIGRSMQTANGSIYNSMKSVFNYVEVTAQEYGGFFASDAPIDTNPETLEKRFVQRAVQTKQFSQYIFRDAFSPLNVDYVRKRLGDRKFVNTDSQPSAYLYNLMLWSEVHGGRALRYLFKVRESHVVLISLVILLFVLLSTFRQKRRVIYFSIFTTGFSSMAFMLVIIFAYQASYGYVYEMIGMLTATFMVGIFAGAYLSRYSKRALQTLFYLELMTITLALISSMFFRAEPLFYVLILLLGLITGRQFSAANLCLDEPGVAGKLYGIDLVGSFLGAFVPSIVLIPLFGSLHTLFFVAGMKAFSAVMILSIKER